MPVPAKNVGVSALKHFSANENSHPDRYAVAILGSICWRAKSRLSATMPFSEYLPKKNEAEESAE
jgi:hypothetical protein